MKKLLLILLFLPLLVCGQYEDYLFRTANTNKQFTLSKDNTKKVIFNRQTYTRKLLKKLHVLNINLPLLDDAYINVNLIEFSVISRNHQLIIENRKGKIQEEYKSNLVSYRIMYKDESIGVFIVTDNSITVAFKFNDKQIEISEINGELLLFDVNDCLLKNNFTCSVEKKYGQIIKQPSLNKTVVNTTECLELALEIDYFTRNTFSSNNSCANWGEAIMAGVSQVYNSEINIEISIVTTIIWETTDPYASYVSDASNMLGALRIHWTSNNSSISRDLVHLLTKRSNTGTGGIAYLDVLCNNSWGYGFSAGLNNTTNFNFPNPPYTWNLLVCSHEIGHNIGSNHTHWCGWPGGPIDNCTDVEGSCTNNPISQVGTIMSYCHTTSSGSLIDFHSLVVSYALTPGINGASCLSTCYYYGCTDPSACNYDPLVTIDDGSCNTVYGCMDPLYIEYDATATCDDGSCIYPFPIVLSCVISDASCNPLLNGVSNDGTINLSLTGGIAPYSYTWSNGAITQDINNLLVGNYTVNIIDVQGQIVTETYFISSPSAIDVTIATTNTSGQGISDGSASVIATGGTPPYIFYWISTDTLSSNSDTLVSNDAVVSNLEAGTYILYTIDTNGCYLHDTVIIENTPGIDYYGCTDSLANNYNSSATIDDSSCCGLQLDWDQIGDDIDGEATIDASGRAISYNNSGDIVAIGARWNDGAGIDAGHVRVYQYNGSSWSQLGADIDGEHANDFSGHSLAINGAGNSVAIGAYGNDDNGTNAGHVRVYEYNGSSWIQLGQDIDGELANDFKGFKVDINEMGDMIVVGSYGNDDNGTNSGKTQVYYFDGIIWSQLGSNIYGTNPNDVSSKSLQINDLGNIIAIGSPSNADNGTNSGQVRVFEFLNTDWVQVGQNLNGESNGDFSGVAISLNDLGNIIAIGAKRNDGNGSNAGHVRVFQYGASSWIQIGQDIDGESVGDESGYSLSLNGLGNRIAIGSYLNSDNATESGHARVFYFDVNSWNQIGNDVDGEFANDWSGRSVALNNTGDKLAIGADLNDGNGAHSGHVRVFSYNTSCLEGCTDMEANNYDSTVIIDDGSCTHLTSCTSPPITGLFISDIIDDRVTANFDNMNTYDANGNQECRVDQLRIKYREVGTSSWSQKNMGSPTGYDPVTGICNSTQKTDKIIYNLTAGTTYEWQMRAWYCSTGVTAWVNGANFTILNECPNIENLAVTTPLTTRATFDWDASNGPYEFARIKMRIDSISNPQGSDWFNVGGAGVSYGTFTKNKNGLIPSETYRGQARTWCSPNGGAYNALSWTSPAVVWTQPASNRLEGGEAISNLDVYPNPSRDIFNITFTSENAQDLKVRILNVIGEELIAEDLQQFIGEYTKQIDLTNNAKGIYFLEIETDNGVINKKLILQ